MRSAFRQLSSQMWAAACLINDGCKRARSLLVQHAEPPRRAVETPPRLRALWGSFDGVAGPIVR